MNERIRELNRTVYRARWLRAEVDDVVSVRMSWTVDVDYASAQPLLLDIATMLLDKGTRKRSKTGISEAFENRGADLRFATDGRHVRAGLRCLTRDLAELMPIVAECLWEPAFTAAELTLARQQVESHFMRSRSDTGQRSDACLSAHLFPASHPNSEPDVDEKLSMLEAASDDDVRAFGLTGMMPSKLNVAVVGDISDALCESVLDASFHARTVREGSPKSYIQDVSTVGGTDHVAIPDRRNLDVRMGHAVGMDRSHEDHEALSAGVFALGGNFSSRLMSTVRDRDGLTYGVGSGLQGFDNDVTGAWVTRISLSSENLDRGIEKTVSEIRAFCKEGITAPVLAEVVQTITGSWLVHLGTTSGMAASMRSHMERDLDASEIDEWPKRMKSLDVNTVNRAMEKWLDPETFWICSAGEKG